MVIILTVVTDLKALINSNPTKDLYWRQKFIALSVLCDLTQVVGLFSFTIQIFIAYLEKNEQPGYVYRNTAQVFYLVILITT